MPIKGGPARAKQMATMAAMFREMRRVWVIFSTCWMLWVAYGVAVLFYQMATLPAHPLTSLFWILTIITGFLAMFYTMRCLAGAHMFSTSRALFIGQSSCGMHCTTCPMRTSRE